MRTLLGLKRIGRDGSVLESHREYSRSFVVGLMRGLYIHHAMTPYTTTLQVADVMGSTTREIDTSIYGTTNLYFFPKNTLQLVVPGGRSRVNIAQGGFSSAGYHPVTTSYLAVPAHALGIVIGTDNTAPAAGDAYLGDRIYHGQGASIAAGVLDEETTGDDGNFYRSAADGESIGFVYYPRRGGFVSSIDLLVYRAGNPGNVTLRIQGTHTDSSGNQIADATLIGESNEVNADLWNTSPNWTWETFTFATPVPIMPGMCYYINIYPSRASAGNFVYLRTISDVAGRWAVAYAVNATGAMTIRSDAKKPVFSITGDAPAEIEHGGMDIYGYTVANPNASFTMSRIFRNNSGENITVREAGIYAPAMRYVNVSSNVREAHCILCLARDTFAGITVGSGESLEVAYTPQITV